MIEALGVAAVVGLILANGWFVAMEFAFVAARRGRLQEAAATGDAKAAIAVKVHERLSFMLSGAQLGITVTSLIVGFIAEPAIGRLLEPLVGRLGVSEGATTGVAFGIAFALATSSQMVFGELAPKNLAIAKPEPLARGLARGTWLFIRIAGPLIRFFDSSANRLLRALGIEPVEELRDTVGTEELDLIVEESARRGTLSEAEANRLARAIDFQKLRAADAMVPRTRVISVAADASGRELRDLLRDGHSRFAVTAPGGDLDDVVGVVHARDLLTLPREARDAARVSTLMREPTVVPDSLGLGEVLVALRRARTELAVVVDEYGGTAGIVTLEDVVEELVGDISDESDPAVDEHVEARGEGRWAVPGWWRIDEVERDTGIGLPEGDYETIGGLIMAQLGRIPDAGDRVDLENAAVIVEAMDGRSVARVALEATADQAEGDEAGPGEAGAEGEAGPGEAGAEGEAG
ncbi:MAG: hemolysin family protein, partial [Actinomycetota bacterium]